MRERALASIRTSLSRWLIRRCGRTVEARGAVDDRACLREVRGEFDALGLSAGERGGGLAEADVAEADLIEDVELVHDARNAGEVA